MRPQIVVVDGVDRIDVSDVDTSFLGHSYYGDMRLDTAPRGRRRARVQQAANVADHGRFHYRTSASSTEFVARAIRPTSGTN